MPSNTSTNSLIEQTLPSIFLTKAFYLAEFHIFIKCTNQENPELKKCVVHFHFFHSHLIIMVLSTNNKTTYADQCKLWLTEIWHPQYVINTLNDVKHVCCVYAFYYKQLLCYTNQGIQTCSMHVTNKNKYKKHSQLQRKFWFLLSFCDDTSCWLDNVFSISWSPEWICFLTYSSFR